MVAVLVSWEAIKDQQSLYYRLLLVLGTGMLGVFVARDIILFYLFFEFTLVPLFFLIGIWGSDQRRYAAIKFFLFTLAGSVLTLLGLLAIVLWDWNTRRRAGDDVFHPGIDRRTCRPTPCPTPCRSGSSWPSSPGLPSRCRCFPCTPGCRWPTPRPRRRAASCWRACS